MHQNFEENFQRIENALAILQECNFDPDCFPDGFASYVFYVNRGVEAARFVLASTRKYALELKKDVQKWR